MHADAWSGHLMNYDISRQKTLPVSDAELLADEARYCSFGDTVHY